MSEPASWQLLEHVAAALKRITTAEGFRTNLGDAPIYTNGAQMNAEDQMSTFIYTTDAEVNEQASSSASTTFDQQFIIEAAVPFGVTDNPFLLAHRVRADIYQALLSLRKRMKERPPGVSAFQLTAASIGAPEGTADTIVVQVLAQATLTELLNPSHD